MRIPDVSEPEWKGVWRWREREESFTLPADGGGFKRESCRNVAESFSARTALLEAGVLKGALPSNDCKANRESEPARSFHDQTL